jgi:hypothetical protein
MGGGAFNGGTAPPVWMRRPSYDRRLRRASARARNFSFALVSVTAIVALSM